MLSSIFQAMPLFAWIIIGFVIILGVVVLINMNFFKKSVNQIIDDEPYNSALDKPAVALFGGLKKIKNKNMKKRRKYKK
jgi:ABC-type bacteriocin/lantibiotic exporter with double-glycine peptidase domain